MIRNELIPMYRELYYVYCMLNKACWNEALPPCVITISNRLRTCYAYVRSISETNCPLIAINYFECGRVNNDYLIGILSHEMTHIWQFSQGRCGGHGRDFENEMLRVGLDIPNQLIIMDSPLVAFVKQYRLKNFNLTAHLASMRKGDFSRREQIDFFFGKPPILFQYPPRGDKWKIVFN